jgi:SpoVK/Ycf46/Vps4 family AAA+-type ATPase
MWRERVMEKKDTALEVQFDPSLAFIKRRLITYMDRLISRQKGIDRELFKIVHWLLGPDIVREDLPALASINNKKAPQKPTPKLMEKVRDPGDFSDHMEKIMDNAKSENRDAIIKRLKELLDKRLDQLNHEGPSEMEGNLDLFRKMFGLNQVETELCMFLSSLTVWEEAESYFEDHLDCVSYSGRHYLSCLMDVPRSDISKAVNGKLTKMGIVEVGYGGWISIESDFCRLLLDTPTSDVNTGFAKRIEPEVLPLSAHSVAPEITEHALRLLSPDRGKTGAILIYGKPGVGKTTYAYGLGKELGLETYVCAHDRKGSEWERQAAIMASVTMAGENRNTLVIVDDCDSIIGTRHLWSSFGAYDDRKWLHDVLESKSRMIFIVNDVKLIEESVMRRFAFSIHLKPFSRRQRIKIWRDILQSHNIDESLTKSQIEDLAARFDCTPSAIEQAVGQVSEGAQERKTDLHKAIIMSLEAHESLKCGGGCVKKRSKPDRFFSMESLNVVGMDLDALIEELEAFNEYIKEPENDEVTGISLLFHGPSGAGKTHLGRHIAHLLDRELVTKRGSDLLSPYIGETEENIRKAYDEAEAKEAMLLVDEADSLIFNRERAQRSWELSFTNEFLNCMEQFRGLQIFTTNRLTDLDSASLRRFTYKLEFKNLKHKGKVELYSRLLAPLVGSELDESMTKGLKAIEDLSPGDFKTVRSRFIFRKKDKISHRVLIKALREEVKSKKIHGGAKQLGF